MQSVMERTAERERIACALARLGARRGLIQKLAPMSIKRIRDMIVDITGAPASVGCAPLSLCTIARTPEMHLQASAFAGVYIATRQVVDHLDADDLIRGYETFRMMLTAPDAEEALGINAAAVIAEELIDEVSQIRHCGTCESMFVVPTEKGQNEMRQRSADFVERGARRITLCPSCQLQNAWFCRKCGSRRQGSGRCGNCNSITKADRSLLARIHGKPKKRKQSDTSTRRP